MEYFQTPQRNLPSAISEGPPSETAPFTGTPQSDASTVEYFQTPQRTCTGIPSGSANSASSTSQHAVASAPIQSGGSGSTNSYESTYETDPDYSGPLPQSQPCDKHGVKYVPAGMRRVYVKKRKLDFDSCDN